MVVVRNGSELNNFISEFGEVLSDCQLTVFSAASNLLLEGCQEGESRVLVANKDIEPGVVDEAIIVECVFVAAIVKKLGCDVSRRD